MPLQTIMTNLASIEALIAKACIDVSRRRDDVKLIAVSKGHDFSAIKAAYDYGQRDFGESYAQEMGVKIDFAHKKGLNDIAWHFLGAIQSNKLSAIIKADFIHSLSSLRHAALLNNLAQKTIQIFLQINLGLNPKQQGFFPDDIAKAAQAVGKLDKIALMGLMCIVPLEPAHPPRYWFQKMAELKNTLFSSDTRLSMGMSDDFADAIAMGANYVRIGTRIFGVRNNQFSHHNSPFGKGESHG